ncbi:hypothetical protein NMY22_g9732 [Coprinellus aureogranulatus]|nr:hypothetical protein NMY22_g9732 [Coprinellus aureogranulatus]
MNFPLLPLTPNISVQHTSHTSTSYNTSRISYSGSTQPPLSLAPVLPSQAMFPIGLSALFSSGRQWLNLLLLGVLAEWVHRHINGLLEWVMGWVVVRATFSHSDASYNWLMLWLTKQPSWRQNRSFLVSTLSTGVEDPISLMHSRPAYSSERTNIFVLPEPSQTYYTWFKGRLVKFWIESEKGHKASGQAETCELRIEMYTLSGQSLLVDLIKEAETAYKSLEVGSIRVFRAQRAPWSGAEWTSVGAKRTRPLESVVLEEGTSAKLVHDVKEFMESREWYRQRGIPFRRGYLMYGPPGTGKTSFIAALAAELELDIYLLSLGGSDLDDSALVALLAEVPSRAILLVEDIDASQGGVSRQPKPVPSDGLIEFPRRPSITLAGLLNALDGIEASEGRLLFATTNHKETLDPALYRPGRMDVHVEFGNASRYQAKQLFKRFYPDDEFGATARSAKQAARAPAPPSSDRSTLASRQSSMDSHASGYTEDLMSAVSSAAHEIAAFLESSEKTPTHSEPTSAVPGHPRVQDNSGHDIEALSNRFSGLIPERSCTMAVLQEYLMGHRRDPVGASNEENVKTFLDRIHLAESASRSGEKQDEKGKATDDEQGADVGLVERGSLDAQVDHLVT